MKFLKHTRSGKQLESRKGCRPMNSSVCLIWRLRNNIFSENRYEILAERENRMDLKEFFQQNPRAALGFSGGVDSAFLLAMAVKYKKLRYSLTLLKQLFSRSLSCMMPESLPGVLVWSLQ